MAGLRFVDRVHVSTDDPEIAAIAAAHGADCLELRAPELATSAPGFIDLIHHDIPRYSDANGGDQEVLFVLATAALVTAQLFTDAHRQYRDREPELLMSCERYAVSPYWALQVGPEGYLSALFPKMTLVNSQDLPQTLADAGLFYFFNAETMVQYDSVKLVNKLLPYRVPDECTCDVDTEEDWRVLERKFEDRSAAGAGR